MEISMLVWDFEISTPTKVIYWTLIIKQPVHQQQWSQFEQQFVDPYQYKYITKKVMLLNCTLNNLIYFKNKKPNFNLK